jgi:hypothetical protein
MMADEAQGKIPRSTKTRSTKTRIERTMGMGRSPEGERLSKMTRHLPTSLFFQIYRTLFDNSIRRCYLARSQLDIPTSMYNITCCLLGADDVKQLRN